MNRIEKLQQAVRSGQRLSVVSFVTEAGDSTDTRAVPGQATGSATKIVNRGRPGLMTGLLHVRGIFRDVRDLQKGFKDLGFLHRDVAVNERYGGDSAMRRLRILLTAQPKKPLLLLAVSTRGSTSILSAELSGPLTEKDADLLAEVMPLMRQADAAVSSQEVEAWLRSPNPWMVWLGLASMLKQKALTAVHFRGVIERRPLPETKGLFTAMIDAAAGSTELRKGMTQELEALFQLPEKQIPMLRWMALDIKTNPIDVGRTIDPIRLRRWLDDYRTRLGPKTPKDVIDAVDGLLAVLGGPLAAAPRPAR